MPIFVVRYDMRCPDFSPLSRAELYAAALDQAAFTDQHGFDMLVLSEHHGVEDGYLSSPLVMAAAVAGRTSRIPINIAALLPLMHEPLRLAEDIAVLDHASGGRVSYVMGLGYRREEYEMFDLEWSKRGQLIESCIETLQSAWTGEPFDYQGRSVRVTPTPLTEPHPMIMYGGGSPAAARRAARLDLGFFPQHAAPEVLQAFADERAKLGKGPGFVLHPPAEGPGTIFCAESPDSYWDQIGEHLLYEVTQYASWQAGVTSAVHDHSTTIDEMREAGVYVVMTPEELIEHARSCGPMDGVTLHPLCGGMPLEPSWQSLHLIADKVLPALRAG